MATRRSIKFVLALVIAGLGAGTTVAWAGVLIGGHRADHIGAFEPAISQRVATTDPVGPKDSGSATTTISVPARTTPATITRPASDAAPPDDD